MLSQFSGAVFRGAVVGLTVLVPYLVLPDDIFRPTELIAFLAGLLGLLVFTEYRSEGPCILEFRDAPPINRIRFLAFFFIVTTLTILELHNIAPTNLTHLVSQFAHGVGNLLALEFSPVHLMQIIVPADAPSSLSLLVRDSAAVAYAMALSAIGVFVVTLRLTNWPLRSGPFNIWVNLPLFDPATTNDVVKRLQREGRIYVAFGFILPFLLPFFGGLLMNLAALNFASNPQGLIWVICGWAFIPANMVIRGVAMLRVAELVAQKRRLQSRLQENDAGKNNSAKDNAWQAA